jgi:hypothetical protein
MKKIDIAAIGVGSLILAFFIKKHIFIKKEWWIWVIQDETLKINNQFYPLYDFNVVSSVNYHINQDCSRLQVLLQKNNLYILYEIIYKRDDHILSFLPNKESLKNLIIESTVMSLSKNLRILL